tara:strand:+ start:5878 stop:7920 length:2043 start_codon:yes stop_codon:yes gene_type:complete
MPVQEALSFLSDSYGVIPEYHDLNGGLQVAPDDTRRALLRAMGLALDSDADVLAAARDLAAAQAARRLPAEMIVRAGQGAFVAMQGHGAWVLHFDADLSRLPLEGMADDGIVLPGLPVGVHRLELRQQGRTEAMTLLASPGHAPSLRGKTGQDRLWGVTAALYGMHSANSVGLGTYSDLAVAAEGLARGGAAFLGVNPIHNFGWADDEVISPYSPSTREFLNTWHLDCAVLRGVRGLAAQNAVAGMQRALGPVDAASVVDYRAHRQQIKPLLRQLYALFVTSGDAASKADFAAFRAARGQRMQDFALFETLSDLHGPDWRHWPAGLRTLSEARRVGNHEAGAAFHIWLQWQAEAQLSGAQHRAVAAGMPLGLYLDLAVGARPGGAETWCGSGSVATGVSLGAPPDQFNPTGQKWNLTAFAPNKLRDSGYGDLRRTLASSLRFSGVLRVDHVLGMNRSYLFPDNGAPGGYVRQPFASLLAVIAIEATKANTVVIGEDLGLVPDGFREALADHGFYGYSVLQYERDAQGGLRQSEDLRANSLTCFGTHDSPSMRGFYTGHDIRLRQRMGWEDDAGAVRALQKRHDDIASVGGTDSFGVCRQNLHARIAWSPAAMVSVQLDDMLGVEAPQNLPGTVDEYPNWRMRCPIGVEKFDKIENLTQTSGIMRESGRAVAAHPQGEDLK